MMPELLKRCPKCGSANLYRKSLVHPFKASVPLWRLVCEDCDHMGPVGYTLPEAITLWNEQGGFFDDFL